MTPLERLRTVWSGFAPGRRRLVTIAVALVATYVVAGFVLVPAVIKSQIHKQVPKALHRSARLTKARFNPFTLKTTLIGFQLLDRDTTLLFGFDTLVINLSSLSIPQRAVVLDEFRLVKPIIVARLLPDGRPAIHDLFDAADSARPAADSARPAARPSANAVAQAGDSAKPAAMPRLTVRHAAVAGGQITFVDQSRTPVFEQHATDLSAEIGGFSTLPRKEGDHDLTILLSSGARIEWSGTSTLQPLLLKGRFTISKLPLHALAEALAGKLPLELREGQADLTVEYQGDRAANGAIHLAIPDASLILSNLAVRPRGATDDWLKVPEFGVRHVRASYPQRTARVGSLTVKDLWVSAAYDSSGLNWQRYLDAFKPESAAADTAPAWTAVLDTIQLLNGTAVLADRRKQPAAGVTVSSIQVALTNVSTDSTQRLGLTAGALIGGLGRFTMTGGAVRSPLRADFDLSLQNLQLSLAQPYLGEQPPAHLDSGAVSVRGSLHLRDTHPQTLFEGSAAVTSLGLADSADSPMLGWPSMTVRGIRLTTAPDLLRIRQVTVDHPFMRIAISREKEFNFSPVINAVPVDTTAPGFPYEVQEITLVNGQVDFSDFSLVLPFRTLVDSTQGSIRDVASFGATNGSMEIAGRTGTAGSARASGRMRFAEPFKSTSIQAEFRNVELPTFTPYSAQFMGYSIRTGTLDLDVTYNIVNRQLEANHHIVATNLNLGDKVEGGESPGFLVRLAVSLMKDSRGRITIDAPASGSVDDPQFSYRKMVWDAVKHVMGRIASAPFRFIGGLLGIGGDDVELVDFDPGRSVLLAPERVKLDTLAAELVRKPELTIGVEGRYDSTADEAAIRESMLNARIAAKRDSMTAVARGDTSATVLAGIMEVLYAEQFGRARLDSLKARFTPQGQPIQAVEYQAELRIQMLAAQPVEADFLRNLALSRAAAIRTALLASGSVDSTRVTVADPAAAKRKKAGSNRVASEMTMDAR